MSEKCDECYSAGVQCELKLHSKIRIVSFDHIDQFSLPLEEFYCQLKGNPYLTDIDAEENAQRLKTLVEELKKQT